MWTFVIVVVCLYVASVLGSAVLTVAVVVKELRKDQRNG